MFYPPPHKKPPQNPQKPACSYHFSVNRVSRVDASTNVSS